MWFVVDFSLLAIRCMLSARCFRQIVVCRCGLLFVVWRFLFLLSVVRCSLSAVLLSVVCCLLIVDFDLM